MTCAVIRGVELTGSESSADISGSYRIIQGSMIRHYPEFKKKKKGFAHDVSDILTLHSSYSTWIILACPGRCKTCDMSMRRSSLEIHWSTTVATGIVSPSNFHFPLTAHYGKWISNTQQPWSETWTRPMRPSCSVREEQALCSKSHLVLHSFHPMPHWTHPIISASQSSTALSLCSQCPLRLSAHPPSTETLVLSISWTKKKNIS